jgi:hypothetical protein
MAKENFGHRSRRTDKIKPYKRGAISCDKTEKSSPKNPQRHRKVRLYLRQLILVIKKKPTE